MNNAVYVASLDQPHSARLLLNANSNVAYAPPGYLLFNREGTLMAQRFDAGKLKLLGQAFPVVDQVQFYLSAGSAIFSVSDNGALAYQAGPGGGLSQLTWFDSSGSSHGTVGPAADYQRPRISPDSRRVAVDVIDPRSGNVDVWIYDVSRRTASRFTFDPALDVNPTWSPDGGRIIFNSNRKGASELYQKLTSGTGTEEFLFDCKAFCAPFSWSRDGRLVALQVRDPKTQWDLWIWSDTERKAYPLLQSEFNETGGSFSPDGRWIAYASDETGQNEVYVQTVGGESGRWQISTQGGSHPVWSSDGSQIFFASLEDKLMAVPVKVEPSVEAGEPRALFSMKLKSVPGRRYDVASDGKRFLINEQVGDERSEPMNLVLNWTAELKR